MNSTTLIAECDESLRDLAADVLRKFDDLARGGLALRDGARIRFGWSVLTLRSGERGLRVCEPAFHSDPFQNVNPTIDVTLRVLAGQVRVLKRAGETGTDAGFDEFVLVRDGALDAPAIFLRRQNRAADRDSGWFIGDLDHLEDADAGKLIPMQVYQLLQRRPAAMTALALPVDWVVVIRGAEITEVFDPAGTDRWTSRSGGIS